MTKEEVLERLEQFEGRPIEVFCDNVNILYAGIEGHWLFSDDKGLWEIRKNAPAPTPNVIGMSQEESPYIVTYTEYEHVQFIKAYIAPDTAKITEILDGLNYIGDHQKSIEEVKKEIIANKIMVANSPRGFQNDKDLYKDYAGKGNSYGQFTGTLVSMDKDGFPKAVEDELL